MKGRLLLLSLGADGAGRAALVVDGRLEDLLADPVADDAAPSPGEIWSAKVDRLVPKAGAAFVRLGAGRMGYLKHAEGAREGEVLAVQVVSLPEGGKASPVTRRLLHKGRLVMLTPAAPGINVSRQIREEDKRRRLADAVAAAMAEAPEKTGAVIRTAARGATEEELAQEVAGLLAELRAISGSGGAERLVVAMSAIATGLREWTDPLPASVLCDEGAWARIEEEAPLPLRASARLRERCERSRDGDPFDHLGVWEELARLQSASTRLPSGGSIVVEPTTALVAVDVNTGGEFSGGAALTANLEAARELPRQLRLRGLGGQVVIDFAPLRRKDRRRVEEALKTAFRRDPVETALLGWTPLGHFELSRKRERRPLETAS